MSLTKLFTPTLAKTWDELTKCEQTYAREQYIYTRACEDEITEEEALTRYSTADDNMRKHIYEIDRNGALTVII